MAFAPFDRLTAKVRRVLVLGGTGWLGREIVRETVEEGAEVVCLARGESGSVPTGARLVRADRRSPDAYDEVLHDWDEVVELAYEPELVTPALDALADHAAHWTLVSTVSVYERNDEPGADESAGVVTPRNLSEYPDAKVAAERATSDRLGSRLSIARPGLIVGPGDPTDRFGYWPARFSRTGPVLVPNTAGRFVQAIDVADLAAWIRESGRSGLGGVVNAVGEIHEMEDFLQAAAAVAGFDGELVAVEDDVLVANGVQYWAGPKSIPLWLPLSDAGFAQRSGSLFLESGGRVRPLRETLSRVLDDERARGVDRPRRSGLTMLEEDAVLRAAR